jgi:hypothetical protein
MESLARFRNVHVKVSSLPLVSGSAPLRSYPVHPVHPVRMPFLRWL